LKDNKKFARKKGQWRGRQVDSEALKEVRALLGDESRQRDLLLEHLHKVQDKFGFISAAHLVALAEEMNLAHAEIFEVASFYHHFDIITEGQQAPPPLTIRICESLSCEMHGAQELIAGLQNEIVRQNNLQKVRIQRVPCVGRCAHAPIAVVGCNPIENAMSESISLAIRKQETQAALPDGYCDYQLYLKQQGYQLLTDCMTGKIDVESILEKLENSNLRGLGGAGFPAGRKWRILRNQLKPRIVAINIDEGEPGTMKDRFYLERDPHRFLEGSLIAAWAIEAEAVYIYLRDEYAGCRQMLEKELKKLRANPPCSLPDIYLRRGAGAYVCGEESAMIESLEGKRGMPRLRPPYLAEVGLFGRPTLEQNMETMHWVRDIVEKGPEWFIDKGRHGRKGLRSFSVSGRVKTPGVHLAPAGITLNELINEYCDGMQQGHHLYGYFPGGASGGILPASLADIPLDFDTLQEYGCFIGSAAIVVMSQYDSARKLALNAMRFFADESCGQCTPCRSGTAKAVQLMQAEHWDTELLQELSEVMVDASICGLGQAAPNPLLCALKYFPQEFGQEV